MSFIDGYASLCSAAGSGAVTEQGLQPRQAISFSLPEFRHPVSGVYGISRNVSRLSFSYELTGPIVGLAVFDAPTGGNLLLVLPFATPRGVSGGGKSYVADPGDLNIAFMALAEHPNAASYSGSCSAGAVVGQFWDTAAIVGANSVVPGPGAFVPATGYIPAAINSEPAAAGVALTFFAGMLIPTTAIPTPPTQQ